MVIIAPHPINYIYSTGLILVTIMLFTFIKIRFIWSILTGLTIIILYEISIFFLTDIPVNIAIANNFFFLSANIIGMITCYSIEYRARHDFYLNHLITQQTETIATTNHKLEEKFNELKKSKDELQNALEEISTLQSILPICSYCKNIRDDEGSWEQMESYISSHSNTKFSHGICPDCLVKARKDAGLDSDK